MNYNSDIPYLYGKLNNEIKVATYTGVSTDSVDVTVDNVGMTISAEVNTPAIENIIKTFIANNEFIVDAN